MMIKFLRLSIISLLFFAVSNLNIPPFVDPSVKIDHIEDPTLRIIEQYKNHPSVVPINEKNRIGSFPLSIYKFRCKKEFLILDVSNASQDSDIPTKIIKVNADIYLLKLYKAFNRSLIVGEFPSGMKLGMWHLCIKKVADMIKVIISLLAFCITYQVFEKCLQKQISDFFDTILSKYQCGFRKGHGAQHCIIALPEKWHESIDRGLEFAILLTFLMLLIVFHTICLLLNYLHMCLTIKQYALYMIIWGIVNKEIWLQTHRVHGKKFYMVFPKDQYWGYCYLMQTCVTFLLPWAIKT